MNQENTGLDEIVLEKFAAGGTVEFENYLPRSRSGMRTWEFKIRDEDGSRRIVVIRDSGLNVTGTEVAVQPFTNRAERNEEICRLYNECHLSQVFLANLFNISQSAVSVIIKNCKCIKL